MNFLSTERSRLSRIIDASAIAGIGGLALLCAATLLQRPVLGLADNLDGGRVMAPAGIAPRVDPGTYPELIVPRLYDAGEASLSSHFSSAAAMAWAAKQLGFGLAGESNAFDVRQLGALYGLLVVALLAGALIAGVAPLLVLGLAWVIADPVHLLYFNSFYADVPMLLGVLGTTFWLLAWGDFDDAFFSPASWRELGRVGLLAALFFITGMSRGANAAVPLLVMALPLARWFAAPVPRPARPVRTALVSVPLIALSALPIIHFVRGSGPRFEFVNSYHAVFNGIAEVASDQAAALRALDIPDRFRDHVGRSVYEIADRTLLDATGAPEPSLARLSRVRLAGLYLSDPRALARTEARLRAPLALARPPMPNYENEPGRYYTRAGQLSSIRALLVDRAAPALWCGLLGLGGYLAVRVARRRPLTRLQSTLAFLWVCFASQSVLAVLGEGFFGIRLHLAGARLALDLLLVVAGFAALSGLAKRVARG